MATNQQSSAPIEETICVTVETRGRSKSFRGYKIDMLHQRPSSVELVTCPVCQGILREALVFEGKTTCRNCCENEELAVPSVVMRQGIETIPGKCPFSKSGCDWTGALGNLEIHIAECEFSVKCPYSKFGCSFESANTNEMTDHKIESKAQHFEMKLAHLENENLALKKIQNSLKCQISAIVFMPNISKFVESLKMCFQGAEWRLKGHQITGSKGEMVGPDFYIKGYHLQLVGRVEDNLVLFRVRRISGEFDSCISPGILKYSSIDQRSKEKTTNNTHNHRLDIGVLTEPIYQSKCTDSVNRFYFHIELC
ncbi:TNF receptor-associated factor 6 [Oopsacas minuta]|uniref:TNF receptor-associated factor 6 n=1 Tax=Oopsacas minuta TaxID=111878 RepID=A0AAV7KB17_9METZ|nr:TNF receptor-associated factor 6 [Oopsacas minuta]